MIRRLIVALSAVALMLGLVVTPALAQEEPDNTEACAAVAAQATALDAYEAEVDAAFVGYYAAVDALDAQLPPEFDAQLDAYRDYLAASELMLTAQIDAQQAALDAAAATYDC